MKEINSTGTVSIRESNRLLPSDKFQEKSDKIVKKFIKERKPIIKLNKRRLNIQNNKNPDILMLTQAKNPSNFSDFLDQSVFSLTDALYRKALKKKLFQIILKKEEEHKKYEMKHNVKAGNLYNPYATRSNKKKYKQINKLNVNTIIRCDHEYIKKDSVFIIFKDKIKQNILNNKKKNSSLLPMKRKRLRIKKLFECFFPQCDFCCEKFDVYSGHINNHD